MIGSHVHVSDVEDMIYVEPQLVFPRDQVVMVEVGELHNNCTICAQDLQLILKDAQRRS